jgi:hypothetical protein
MANYAKDTNVPIDRSREEIESTLKRFGANEFLYGWNDGMVLLGFSVEGRKYKFSLPMPDKNDPKYSRTPSGRARRSQVARDDEYELDTRQRWRALCLMVKANLAAVEAGIMSIEQVMVAATVMPNGKTVGDWLIPQINDMYRDRRMPSLLPWGGHGDIVDGDVTER